METFLLLLVAVPFTQAVPDLCISNPCKNGGSCTRKGDDSYFCQCTVRFYGDTCETECNSAFGMENGEIKDQRISASSELNSNHTAIQGRLHFQQTAQKAGTWKAHTSDANQWLQIDLGSQYNKISRVATQGRNGAYPEWVTKYKLQYSDNGVSFQYYREPGEATDKEFVGNTDQDTVVYHNLNQTVTARYIRFRPLTWNAEIAMRVELYGCQDCRKGLGMRNYAISDGHISASSEYSANHAAIQGRLNFKATGPKAGSWSARDINANQWLQVDLGSHYTRVTRVATQGRNGLDQWVTKYKLQYGNDEVNFQYYKEQGQNTDKEFTGNENQAAVVYHDLNPPITARYIRFRPIAWNGYISMRVELYGCIAVSIPDARALYPLNSWYATREINNKQPQGTPVGVSLAPGPNGNEGGSYQFSGQVNSYIEFPNNGGLDVQKSITILCWVYPESLKGPLVQYTPSGSWGVSLWQVPLGLYALYPHRNYVRERYLSTDQPLPLNTWHYVGSSYDHITGIASIWLNGIRVVQRKIAVNMTVATQDDVRMGVKDGDARYFKGRITAFQVYDAALTAKQINTMKNAGLVAPDPPCNVTVDSKSSRVVNISWMAGSDGNSAILNYTVKISVDNQHFRDVMCQGSLSNSACVLSNSFTSASLVNLFPWTTYYIKVLARNPIGASTGSSVVNAITDEEEPDGAPQNVRGQNSSSTSILVKWVEVQADKQNGDITGYNITYQSQTENHYGNVQASSSDRQKELTNLKEYVSYNITVFAFTVKGDGPPSDPAIVVRTDQDKPGAAPEGLKGHNLTSTSILVTWGEVPSDKQHGHIRHYTVIYKKIPGGTDQTKTVTIKRAELEGLDRFSVYNIRVLAATIKGDGPPSDPIFVYTDEDKPSAAPSLTVVKTLNSTSIEVEWEPVPPQNRLGHITKYVVIYTDEKEEREMNVPAPASKAIVNGLKQSTTYTVKILAATVKGNGPPSDPKTATTEDPPTPWPPSDDDIGTTKVYINFVNKQALSNGKPVRFYQIIVIPLTEGQNPGKSSDGKYVKITRNYDDQVEGQPYVTAEFANEKSQRTTFPVGDGKYYSRAGVTEERRKRRATSYIKYLNGKLDDNTNYAVFQRSFFDYDEYENEGFITFIITIEFPTVTVVLPVVVGILALIIVVVVIIMWRRFHDDETKTSSRNSRHCSTQEIVEMSASVNLATSQSAYSNPSTDPSYYDNTNLPHCTEPTTERQATYEAVDGQAANYDDVEPKQEDIYQEIDQGIHYQPLNLNREVHYEGFVKPTAGSAS